MRDNRTISIWFFIGFSLLVNGALILGAGIYQWLYPPERPVVLFQLHANVWWGGLLFVAGALYCWKFYPGRQQKTAQPSYPDKMEEGANVR